MSAFQMAAHQAAEPPKIPERHPGRLSRVKTNVSMRCTGVPTEYLDVWEHATLLNHGLEWQSAAETFLMLSRQIEDETESTLCLLNAALMFSRIDDFAIASQIINEAELSGDLLPLAMFVLGHVEFEQENHEKSQEAFQLALSSLNAPALCYERYGMDFTLTTSHIQQNLRVFESKSALFGVLGNLVTLPAESLFEAPSRPYKRRLITPAMSRSSSNSDDLPTLSGGSSPTSFTASPIDRQTGDAFSDSRWFAKRDDTWATFSDEYDSDFEYYTPDNKATTNSLSVNSDPRLIGSIVRSLSQRGTPVAAPGTRPSRNGLEPREARVQGYSTRPLAAFLRQSPPQNMLADRSTRFPRKPLSDQSSLDPDTRAQSRESLDLSVEDLVLPLQTAERFDDAPKPSRHPYRSGVGSVLLRENSQSTTVSRPSQPELHRNMSFESTRMNTDSLHSFLCGPTGERQSIRSYVPSDEYSNYSRSIYSQGSSPRSRNRSPLSRPVSMTAVHPALRPEIPSRSSSIKQSSQSRTSRTTEAQSEIPTTKYSEMRPVPTSSSKEQPKSYSRLFSRFTGRSK